MKKEEIFRNCTVSVKDDNGKEYFFEKPKNFKVELLKVRYGAYHNIVGMVINQYNSTLAICYSTTGFVHDGREGFEEYTLKPITFDEFFKELDDDRKN